MTLYNPFQTVIARFPQDLMSVPQLKIRQGYKLGFALWIDESERVAWAQGTHEYRPMGAAVVALSGLFRHRDFRQSLKRPAAVHNQFVGFFGSLEEVNHYVSDQGSRRRYRATPAHLL